jgi:hypothetical protein
MITLQFHIVFLGYCLCGVCGLCFILLGSSICQLYFSQLFQITCVVRSQNICKILSKSL